MKRASMLDPANQEAAGSRSGFGAHQTRAAVDRRATVDPWLGQLVDGRYKVIEILGRGGMGVVYKIKHQRMGKIAAMKVLHSELAENPEVVGRFQREAEAVSRLAHPNTVQVFDFGSVDQALYLVMEYVRGEDMSVLIDRDGPMSFQTLAPLLGQICGSLEEAHALGVVHRDLKPENILVSKTHSGHSFVKVLDFGLAKLSEPEESSSVTSAGSIVGTPYYMSPEQIRADDEVDHRSDIYSFGALLHRLLTAENAFDAKSPVGVLTKHLTEELVPPSERFPHLGLPKELDTIIGRCMAKQPSDRYPTVRELLEDVEQLFTSLSTSSSDLRRPPTSWLTSPDGNTAPVAAMLEVEVDHGMDANLRLRREDLDVFEKQMRRKHSFRMLGIPVLVLTIGAAAAYFVLFRDERVHKEELEPNNVLDEATLVAAGSEVGGYIGKRSNVTTPDTDFFRFTTTPDKQVVSVSVTAPKNIDLSIDLYNMSGKLMKHHDEGGVGATETLRRWRASQAVAVSISGVRHTAAGSLPVENVSDSYQLKVVFAPADARLESEPNDSRADASPLAPQTPVTGFLDHVGDQDVFRVDGSEGEYQLLISGGPDVPFQWRLNDNEKWRNDLRAKVALQRGSIITIRRTPLSADAKAKSKALQSPDLPYTIDLSQ